MDICPLDNLIVCGYSVDTAKEATKMKATDTDRQETVEQMVRDEVDRWDMDALIDYAVEQMYGNVIELGDGELYDFWEQLYGEDGNPFAEGQMSS